MAKIGNLKMGLIIHLHPDDNHFISRMASWEKKFKQEIIHAKNIMNVNELNNRCYELKKDIINNNILLVLLTIIVSAIMVVIIVQSFNHNVFILGVLSLIVPSMIFLDIGHGLILKTRKKQFMQKAYEEIMHERIKNQIISAESK